MYKKISFVVATTLFANFASANQTYELGQIDVLGAKDTKFKSNVVYSEDMVLQEKNTVLDALNTVSGINLYSVGQRGEKAISIRGFNAKYAPVYIDGIPINVPYDGYLDLSNFTTFDLSQIQVSKGLSSPLLGVNTFAGAINLVTKKPTKEIEGTISGGIFSGNGKKTYLNIGTNQGKYYVQASGSFVERDNLPMSHNFNSNSNQDNNKRTQSYAEDKKINLKVGFTPNDTDEYAINYINQKTDKGIPYSSINPNDNSYRKWDYSNKESIYFLSNTNFKHLYLKNRVYYDKFENLMVFYKDKTYTTPHPKPNFKPTPYDANTKGIALEIGQYDTERNSIKLAFNAKQDTQKEIKTNKSDILQINYLSVGIEDTFRFNDNFRVVAGASWDKDSVKEANNGNYKPGGTKPFENTKEFEHESATAFNPMIKFEYDVDESFGIYAGVAKKSKFASLKDRYSFKLGTAIPNPELKPEKTINYEIGANKTFDNQGVKAVLFYSDVKDFIQSEVIDIPNDIKQNLNIAKVKHMGYELEYFYAFDSGLSFDANYTRLLAEDKENKKDIIDVAKHNVNLSLSYELIKDLIGNVNMQYSSGRHTDEKDRKKDVGGAALWNAKLAYQIVKGLTVDVGASNIFDKNYEYSYGYPEAGRVVYSNLTYKF